MKHGRCWAWLLLLLALHESLHSSKAGARELIFRVGASVGSEGRCEPLYEQTAAGYNYFFSWLAAQPPRQVLDAAGRSYTLRFQFRLQQHDCTEAGRAAALDSLINGSAAAAASGAAAMAPVHVLLGGNGINAEGDALQADAASRILLHCCTARDSVFMLDLPHVYGLFTPASMYTGAVLRTMAFSGIKRVAVAMWRDSPLYTQLCDGALRALPVLAKLRPEFGADAAALLNYTAAEADEPGFWERAADAIVEARPDALVACDEVGRTGQLMRQLRARGYQMKAQWLASYGSLSEFLSYLGKDGEYALTTVQWTPDLPYADRLLGTARQFADSFSAATGLEASSFSAAAAATGYVLMTVLGRAVGMCDLGGLRGNVSAASTDDFMWRQGALVCGDQARTGIIQSGADGQLLVQYLLKTLQLDTFFGPVGFNNLRQNYIHPPVVAQLLNNQLSVVVPLDLADGRLVMPIPWPLPGSSAWASTTAGIVIITLACCLAAVCLALGLFMLHRWLRPRLSLAGAVAIDPSEIQVDVPPVRNMDGSYEAGEGMYRGARVKLEVAVELLTRHQPASPLPVGTQRTFSPRAGGGGSVAASQAPSPAMRPPRRPTVTEAAGPQQGQLSPLGTLHGMSDIQTVVISTAGATAGDSSPAALPSGPMGGGGGGAAATLALFHKPSADLSQQGHPVTPREFTRFFTMQSGLQAGLGGGCGGGVVTSRRTRSQVSAMVWRALRLQHPHLCPILGIVWEWPLGPAAGLARTPEASSTADGGGGGGSANIGSGGGTVPVVVRLWYDLGDLASLLENETVPLPLLTKAGIARGVAEALAYLHAQVPAIVASPLHASRILIDRNFNPHLFLSLTHLDPVYGAAQQQLTQQQGRAASKAAHRRGSADGSRVGTQNQSGYQQQTSVTESCATAVAAANDQVAAVGNTLPPLVPRPATQHHVVLVDAASPVLAATGNAAVRMAQHVLPYTPSREQDVCEFGRLLGRIFTVVPGTADSSRLARLSASSSMREIEEAFYEVESVTGDNNRSALTLAQRASGAGDHSRVSGSVAGANMRDRALSSGGAAAGMGGGGGAALTADEQWQQDEEMLDALESVCVELATLARSCLHPDPAARPTLAQVTAALEHRVRPALSGGSPGGSSFLRGAAGPGSHHMHNARRASMDHACGAGAGAGGGGGEAAAAHLRRRKSGHYGGGASGVLGQCRPDSSTRGVPVASPVGGDCVGGRSAGHVGHMGHIAAADDFLFDFFPPKVARALIMGEVPQPERYECVSIFFSDVVGYTDLCSELQPHEVMDLMHRLYSLFDSIIGALQLFKVETVGDAYLAVGNLRCPQPDCHARLLAQFAFDAVRAANAQPIHPDRPELGCVRIRVGLHCGPVVGSVVGTLNRRYCLFGDAVNTAARMEHNSEPNRVHCSGVFATLLAEQWSGAQLSSRGIRNIKGKGPMETFWVEDPAAAEAPAAGGAGGGDSSSTPRMHPVAGPASRSPSSGMLHVALHAKGPRTSFGKTRA